MRFVVKNLQMVQIQYKEGIMASYKSSRLTKGNLFFPDTIETKDGYLIYNKRKLFGSNETSLNYNKITAVSLKNGIIFFFSYY